MIELAGKGLLPEFVQVGNEVNNGIAREDPETDDWWSNRERNVRLLNAGISAVRKAAQELGREIGIVLHIAQPENVEAWVDQAAEAGLLDFDIIGVSYYSQWSTVPLNRLQSAVERIVRKYGKPVAIVETAYAWTLDGNDNARNILWKDSLEEDYRPTTQGQRKYLIDQMDAVLAAGGLGIVYWEPAWISTRCETRWFTGSAWENAALFDYERSELHEGADFLGQDYGLSASAEASGVAPSVETLEHWSFYRYGRGERFDAERIPDNGWTQLCCRTQHIWSRA